MSAFVSDLDTPLLKLSPKDSFTLRDAVQGILALGGIGSGKTSGTGNAVRQAYLRAGMGGLVMVAKPEEIGDWIKAAKENGRAASVILFDETQGYSFIDYEFSYHGLDGQGTVVETLMGVSASADHAAGNGVAGAGEEFWTHTLRQNLNYVVPAIYIAYGKVTVTNIIDFVTTAATEAEQYADPQWIEQSYAGRTLKRMVDSPAMPVEEAKQRELMQYWLYQFPAIPEKTRGNIVITLSSKFDRFRHGRLKRCFCEKTTIVPEMMFHGAIIIMCMPVMTWKEDGIIGQQLFLHAAERAIEARNGLDRQHQLRPVFLYADECHYFVTEKDEAFLSTCRGSRACPVFLTQTLPTLYARMGHTKTAAAQGLIGKFGTLVCHQNACHETNEYVSKVIGRDIHQRKNESRGIGSNSSFGTSSGTSVSMGNSSSMSFGGGSPSHTTGRNTSSGWSDGRSSSSGSSENWSQGTSEQMDNIIEPAFFARNLKSGGPRNGGIVTAVWFKAGASFHHVGSRNFMLAEFKQ